MLRKILGGFAGAAFLVVASIAPALADYGVMSTGVGVGTTAYAAYNVAVNYATQSLASQCQNGALTNVNVASYYTYPYGWYWNSTVNLTGYCVTGYPQTSAAPSRSS